MLQPFWIKKNAEGKYGIVRGKEALEESNKAADWAYDKTSKALNTTSALVGGGPKGVKELWKTGDTSSTVGEKLPQKLGINNPLGAFVVGMAGEVLTPEPTDIMGGDIKDIPRVFRAANKADGVKSIHKLDPVQEVGKSENIRKMINKLRGNVKNADELSDINKLVDINDIAAKSANTEEFFNNLKPTYRDIIRKQWDGEGISKNQAINDYYANVTGKNRVMRSNITKVPDLDLDLEKRVIKKWGTTDVPENAAFISSNGEYISWGGGNTRFADHREIAEGDLQEYINKTKGIRVNIVPEAPDVNIDITYKPNPKQIEALKNMVKDRHIFADISNFDGGIKSSGEFNYFGEWLEWIMNNGN